MTFRSLVAALALVLMTSCGDDDPGDAASDTTGPAETTAPTSSVPPPSTTATSAPPSPRPAPPPEALDLTAEVPTRVPAGPHSWQFAVTNRSDAPVVLTFPTAQRGEAVIERDDGTVVHRWSNDRFFTQQVHEVPLAPGQTEVIDLADDLSGVEPGFYRLLLEPAIATDLEPLSRSIRVVPPGT